MLLTKQCVFACYNLHPCSLPLTVHLLLVLQSLRQPWSAFLWLLESFPSNQVCGFYKVLHLRLMYFRSLPGG